MRKYRKMALVMAAALIVTACGNGNASDSGGSTDAAVSESTKGQAADGEQTAGSDEAVTITIWYEGNDSRLPFFKAAEAEMQKDYPNYSIEAITFDNSTLVTRSLQAVTTTGGVDLIFNEANRLMETYQQSGGAFEALDDVMANCPNSDVITDADKMYLCANGQMVIFPVNRSCSGLGYRTDVEGVEVTEDKLPNTFEKFVALGKEYKAAGINGWTLSLGDTPEQAATLFMTAGSGHSDYFISSEPKCIIPELEDLYVDVYGLYTAEDSFWDQDAINEGFAEMYTKIQSGSVGMFRAGNWNVAGWDAPDSGVGEYSVTTWPSMEEGVEGALILGGVRGMALPKNAPEKEAAKIYLQYCMKESAQQASFDTMGSCMDYSAVDVSNVSKNQKVFLDPSIPLRVATAYAGSFEYYPEIIEQFQKGLYNALSTNSEEELRAAIEKTADDIQNVIDSNR